MTDIKIRIKNGLYWEYLTINLDELMEEGYVDGETDLGWKFEADLVEEGETVEYEDE